MSWLWRRIKKFLIKHKVIIGSSGLILILSFILCLSSVTVSKLTKVKTVNSTSAIAATVKVMKLKETQLFKIENATKSKTALENERPDQTVLKSTDKGEDVIRIQTRLKKYGYNIVVDGDYGNETAYAVMDFQQRHNLEISGIVSGLTLNDLYQIPINDNAYKPATQSLLTAKEVSSEVTYESTLNSIESTSNTNNYILVNLSQQRVYIFYGANHNWKLINAFSCGSGKADTPTIKGHFSIGVKGLYFKSGTSIYCKYFSQISGNYLFHSILYDKKGNVLDGNLGVAESHGCIRLALRNAKYIYDNVPIGSSVWIE